MADWTRTDFEMLECQERWHIAIFSSDPIRGVPPMLAISLSLSLALIGLLR